MLITDYNEFCNDYISLTVNLRNEKSMKLYNTLIIPS